jgi:uncharacterized phiE125 gp8 family phage protein
MLCPLRLDVDALPAPPLTLIDEDVLKAHCRIEAADDDELLDVYLRSAIGWAEATTHRAILARTHVWVLRDFGRDRLQEIRLPRGRTVSVDGVEYFANGSALTLYGPSSDLSPPGADYQEDLRGDAGAVLMPPRGGSWPSVDSDVPAPVAISFTAGYTGADLPADLKYAMMFYVADCYDLRGTPDFDPAMLATSGVRFAPREALISPWRLPRVY